MRSNRRRGKRIVLWTICLFWLIQLGGGLVLDHFWTRARFPWQARVYDELQAQASPPDIVFFGSSRFGSNINCAIVDAVLKREFGDAAPRSFNAFVPAGDPTTAERMFAEMTASGYRPKLVVIEVSPETVAERDNWLYQHAMRLLDWRDVPEAAPALVRNGRIMYLLRARLMPLYAHRYQICQETISLAKSLFWGKEPIPSPPRVPLPEKDPELPALTADVKQRMEKAFADITREVQDYRAAGVAARRLDRMLARCRSLGVDFILVGVPVSTGHRRAYTPHVLAAYREYIDGLLTRHGGAYTDWHDKLVDNCFSDGHHVNPEGAIHFSRRLTQEVLVPCWQARRYQEIHVDR